MRAVRRGVLADRALHRVQGSLDARDRAWLHELVYGTLRLRGRLDHRIAAATRRSLGQVDADLLDVLRLGTCQLTEMGGVPAWAAVNEAVELAKPGGAGAAGFVNGVLKAVARDGHAVEFPDPDADPVGHLTTWGSHPRWLVERWLVRFGLDGTRRLVEANNQKADLFVRPLRNTVAEAVDILAGSGIGAEPVPATLAVRVMAGTLPEAVLAALPAVVQDPAAGLVVDCVAPEAGDVVIDLCAAPGGKAIGLAAGPARFVVAADLSGRRLRRLRENVLRVGGLPLAPIVADGRQPALGEAEIVLVDAPCSGTGTFRRHPDARWRLDPNAVAQLVRLQDELLDAAAGLVARGGVLVYATCSMEAEENEMRIDRFLSRAADFEAESCSAVDRGFVDGAGRLSVLPHVHGFDGAFAARLRRRQ